jgi:hypothetical protein
MQSHEELLIQAEVTTAGLSSIGSEKKPPESLPAAFVCSAGGLPRGECQRDPIEPHGKVSGMPQQIPICREYRYSTDVRQGYALTGQSKKVPSEPRLPGSSHRLPRCRHGLKHRLSIRSEKAATARVWQ